MPTIVGLFTIYEQEKFYAQLSWAWKKFYNLGPWNPFADACFEKKSMKFSDNVSDSVSNSGVPENRKSQRQSKIATEDILIFYFYLSKKIRLDF